MLRHGLTIAMFLMFTIMAQMFSPVYAQQFSRYRCSDNEIIIEGDRFAVIRDNTLTLPARTSTQDCKVIFTTEAATNQSDPQLLGLGWAFSFPGQDVPAFLCLSNLLGPVITQVNGGIDETHTLINFLKGTPNNPHGALTITPCVNALPNQTFRLRKHCLLVECPTNQQSNKR